MSKSNKASAESSTGPRYKVQTPVALFTGQRAGVYISSGVGYTNSYKSACECRQLGYVVTDEQTGAPFEPAERPEEPKE